MQLAKYYKLLSFGYGECGQLLHTQMVKPR